MTGFIAANLSMVVMTRAVASPTACPPRWPAAGPSASRPPPGSWSPRWPTPRRPTNGAFLILLELAGVILALVLAAVYVIRMMAVVLLAAAAPILLALYALPQTAWAARWYCRAGVAVLAIQAAQGLVLSAAVKVFFTPGWLPGTGGYLEQVLITLCLLYIMMRIPFWIARPVLSPFGPSPARRALRFAFTAAVLSRVAPVLSGRSTRPPRAGGAARPGSGASPGRGPGSTRRPGPGPAQGGPPPPPGSPPRPRPRHAAPPPLPGGGSARPGRHEAPPPLPADVRPQRPARPAGPPPLPVTRPRHAVPPPLPARGPGTHHPRRCHRRPSRRLPRPPGRRARRSPKARPAQMPATRRHTSRA